MDSLAVVGVIFIVVLCLVAYTPIQTQLNSEWFLALSYGYFVSKMFPVIMTVLGVFFSLCILYVSSNTFMGEQR